MTIFHSLTFYISGAPGEISPGHLLWHRPLSGRSEQFSGRAASEQDRWTIGDYFLAAKAFVLRPTVLDRISGVLGADWPGPGSWDVALDLQKHGAFYHPVKMTVEAGAGRVGFALNGAVSAHGRELAGREETFFTWLETRLDPPVTPRVVASGDLAEAKGPASFLMAEWLEGYHEFHITCQRGEKEVVVWRPKEGNLYLSPDEALPAYENIARILTRAYDPVSGAQVLLWHHAAGDFILAPDREGLPVKLITVRACGSLVDDEILAQGPLPGLLFFFVNLGLRMQMDRLDGVGDPVLLGPKVLAATARGFLAGLEEGRREGMSAEEVWEFLGSFPESQIRMVLEQVLASWPAGPSEQALIAKKMPGFAGQIRDLFKSEAFFDFY